MVTVVLACTALLGVSCGSAESSPAAEKTTTATQTSASSAAAAPRGPAVVLLDLSNAGAAAAWTTVNDPVMGGKSASTVSFGDGGVEFSGSISLENNGGFASARSPQDPDIGRKATGANTLRAHARGDGKTYVLKLGAGGRQWSYIHRFTTEAGVPRIYELPVESFQPVGERLDPAPDAPQTLDPSTVDQVGIYILDKQQGPFALTLSAIDATF